MLLDLAIVPAYVRCCTGWSSKSLNVLSARVSRLGTVIGVVGRITPSSIRAEAVMTLPVLPGSYASVSGRLPRSSAGEAPGLFGSKVGAVATASRSPVAGR